MVKEQSKTIGSDAQLATLMRHKWQAEIERAVDKVKLGVVPGRKRTKTDKWFRRQWFRAMIRDGKRRYVDGRLSENRMKNKISSNQRELDVSLTKERYD